MTSNAMELARQTHLSSLYEPRSYRPGKFTNIGAGKTQRETILELKGPGVLKRVWTTHANAEHVRLHVYVDGQDEPVLSGLAHELAQAAERICCPQIPLGGYYDHRSANLYLPISFRELLRIDVEPDGETGDGPYWQIDYALGSEEDWPLPVQRAVDGKPAISVPMPDAPQEREEPYLEVLDEDLELASASPKNLWLEGGGTIRRIEISGRAIESLLLRIAFDGERGEDDRLDGPFQVDAPLRYLVGSFNNACVERLGSRMVIHFPMPFRTRAGIQLLTGMDYGSFSEKYHFNVRVFYEKEPPPSELFSYFHARFVSEVTNGHDDFECCSTRGRGHFVGVHLFDTGHDHGGGDNIFFDSGADTAGQLHGVCGEDYFHMAYMRIWNQTSYSGCPSHSARYRYHLEMPVPFSESFVFNWGSFASQPAKAVAFWYQATPSLCEPSRELRYTLTGPFPPDEMDKLQPGAPLPEKATPWPRLDAEFPTQSWRKRAQQGFVDLCHAHRRYLWPVPPSTGVIPSNTCTCAETKLWAARSSEAQLRVGCDDPVHVYVNGHLLFSDDGRQEPDPFRAFQVTVDLLEGLNTIRVVVGNTPNCNWHWNGFSLVIESNLSDEELLYTT